MEGDCLNLTLWLRAWALLTNWIEPTTCLSKQMGPSSRRWQKKMILVKSSLRPRILVVCSMFNCQQFYRTAIKSLLSYRGQNNISIHLLTNAQRFFHFTPPYYYTLLFTYFTIVQRQRSTRIFKIMRDAQDFVLQTSCRDK